MTARPSPTSPSPTSPSPTGRRRHQLYDRAADPRERVNLATGAGRAGTVEAFRAEVMRNHLDLNDVERNARWPR